MKVVFIYKSGRKRLMAKHYADILKNLGHGDYQALGAVDLAASVAVDVPSSEDKKESGDQGAPEGSHSGETLGLGFDAESQAPSMSEAARVIDLNALNRDELIALAKERDVKIHGNASDEKIRDALMESTGRGAN